MVCELKNVKMIFFLLIATASGAVLINEIMYNHVLGGRFEYVELFNNGAQSVNVGGWILEGCSSVAMWIGGFSVFSFDFILGIGNFPIPAGTMLAANDYLVLAASKVDLLL